MKQKYEFDEDHFYNKNNSLLNISPQNISEAIFYLIEFKNRIKNVKKGKFKAYLVISDLFDFIKERLNIDFNNYELNNNNKKDKYYFSPKLNNLKKCAVEVMESLTNMKEFKFEIVDEKFIKKFLKFKDYNEKHIIYNKISENEQQIIFKDNSSIKISIENQKQHLRVFEPPIILGEKEKKPEVKDIIDKKNIDDYMAESNSIKGDGVIQNILNVSNHSKIANINKPVDISVKNSKNKNDNKNNLQSIQNSFIENGSNIYKKERKIGYFIESRNSSLINNNSLISPKNSVVGDERKKTIESMKTLYIQFQDFFSNQDKIDYLLNKTINPIYELNNYLIINKNYFNKLLKIFEDENNYTNDKLVCESFEDIKNILDIGDTNLENFSQSFNQRKRDLEDNIPFNIKFEENKTRYPSDFILIDKETICNLSFKINYDENNFYKILFGEKHVFIKNRIDEKIIYVCSRKKLYFKTELVLEYEENDYFENDIIEIIKGKGALDDFFKERNIDLTENSVQRNVNKEGDILGTVIIINYKKDNNKNSFSESIDSLFKEKENKLNNDKENDEKQNKLEEIKINPYLKALFLSFLNIESLCNHETSQTNGIYHLFTKFTNSYRKNAKNSLVIINEIEKTINDINPKALTNFLSVIKFILTKMHEELNKKRVLNDNYYKEEKYQEDDAYNEFKDNYFSQNESKIQEIFFGIKEKISNLKCCSLSIFSFELFQYIYISLEEIKDSDNLQVIINNKMKKKFSKNYCKMCDKDSETEIEEKIRDYPEVLIIILDNNNEYKKKIDFQTKIKIGKGEYNFLSCITLQENENSDFGIFFRKDMKWKTFNNNHYKEEEVGNKIGKLIQFPHVLYFTKNNLNSSIKTDNNMKSKINGGVVVESVLQNSNSNQISFENNDKINNKDELFFLNDYKKKK